MRVGKATLVMPRLPAIFVGEFDHLASDCGKLFGDFLVRAGTGRVENFLRAVERRPERRRPSAKRVDYGAQCCERAHASLPPGCGDDASDRAPVEVVSLVLL